MAEFMRERFIVVSRCKTFYSESQAIQEAEKLLTEGDGDTQVLWIAEVKTVAQRTIKVVPLDKPVIG